MISEIVGVAADNSVDLVVVAGDLFDSSSPTAVAEQIVWRGLLDLAEVAPVLAIGGNHDNPGRLDAVAPLLEMAGVTMVGAPVASNTGGLVWLPDIDV